MDGVSPDILQLVVEDLEVARFVTNLTPAITGLQHTILYFVSVGCHKLEELGDTLHVEGLENKEWILLDYFNVLVHIFQPEAREYYNIEALWNDADIQKF